MNSSIRRAMVSATLALLSHAAIADEASWRLTVVQTGAGSALVKGGHRDGPPNDLLAERSGGSVSLTWLEGERIEAGPVHGTGCALASAIAAELAKGGALRDCVDSGRGFVAEAYRRARQKGRLARFLVFNEPV